MPGHLGGASHRKDPALLGTESKSTPVRGHASTRRDLSEASPEGILAVGSVGDDECPSNASPQGFSK